MEESDHASPTQVRRRQPATLVERMRERLAAKPQDAQAAVDLAWAYYAAGEYQESEAAFAQASTLDPGDVEPAYGMGMARRQRGDKAGAMQAFERALRLSDRVQDRTRAQLLQRLAKGHINFLRDGDWDLEREVWRR
jgi:cytochrome c-type biogenesis protein CcmH/NrfG